MYLFLLYILPKSFSLLCPTVPPGPLLTFVYPVLKKPWSPKVSMYTSLRSAELQSSGGRKPEYLQDKKTFI